MNLVSWMLSKLSRPGAQYSRKDHDLPAQQPPEEQASRSSTARQNAYSQAMKRKTAAARKVHTVHGEEGEDDNPDGTTIGMATPPSLPSDADDK